VNTGWSGGKFGVGKRMSIRHTRALLRGALDGSLTQMEFHKEPFFGLAIPAHVPGIPDEVLDPRRSWAEKTAYDHMAKHLIERFEENFAAYEDGVGEDVKAVAIRAAAAVGN
jgi:phosphoenolpyruvate carboxykinase (ATP)